MKTRKERLEIKAYPCAKWVRKAFWEFRRGFYSSKQLREEIYTLIRNFDDVSVCKAASIFQQEYLIDRPKIKRFI